MVSRPGRVLFLLLAALLPLPGCGPRRPDPGTLTVLIESSPTSLDPRVGTDAVSERLGDLLFDGLVERTANFDFAPALATSWRWTDPTTLVLEIRPGVRFHDGRPMRPADVKWTLDSTRDGTLVTPKAGSYASVSGVDADDHSVTIHLRRPDNSLLANLAGGALGVVPSGSGGDFWRHPVGTGPFRFLRQQVDAEVALERNPAYWQPPPRIERLRFAVVPDAITRALELEKQSADIAVSALTADQVRTLASVPWLRVDSRPGTVLAYLGINTRDRRLGDVRVRQAIAYSIDRGRIIATLLNGLARPAAGLLPEEHWAANGGIPRYGFDPALAERLLDQAGFPRGRDGIRFPLTLKTSTDESTRTLAAVLQQQLGAVGIRLELRSYEFATFYSDVSRGAFELYSLRWIGGNESPDIFAYAFSTARFPPRGANRGRYSNPALDALLEDAASAPERSRQKQDYDRAQQILAEQVPAINLWYLNTVAVYNRRLADVTLTPSGDFRFLCRARLLPPG